MQEKTYNVKMEVIAGELKTFYHQNGGSRLLPSIIRDDTDPEIVTYYIEDDESQASILLRPTQNGGCVMTVNDNETEIWGWVLGESGRSELGINTYLGADVSERCVDFCNEFIEYLEIRGFVELSNQQPTNLQSKGGRERHKENDWAKQQVLAGKDKEEVFNEWQVRRKAEGRPEFASLELARESFRKAIR